MIITIIGIILLIVCLFTILLDIQKKNYQVNKGWIAFIFSSALVYAVVMIAGHTLTMVNYCWMERYHTYGYFIDQQTVKMCNTPHMQELQRYDAVVFILNKNVKSFNSRLYIWQKAKKNKAINWFFNQNIDDFEYLNLFEKRVE